MNHSAITQPGSEMCLAAAVVVGRAIDEMGGDDDHTHPQRKGQ